MTSLNEKQQRQQLKLGDRAVLADLIQQHHGRLFNLAYRMLHHREDAADVTQQAVVNIIQHAADFRGQSSVGTWMTRILMNQALSHLRRNRVRHASSLDAGGEDGQDQVASLRHQLADTRELSPPRRVEESEMLAHLKKAIAELEGPFRAVLVLRDIDQRDYHNIADILDLPVGTVKSRLFRARLALRQQLQHLTGGGHDGGRMEVRDE